MNGLTLGSLFDGIGGFPLAAQRCGIRALWASEIEPNCIAITKRHFPEMQHLGSITEIDGGKIPPVDIISLDRPPQGVRRKNPPPLHRTGPRRNRPGGGMERKAKFPAL